MKKEALSYSVDSNFFSQKEEICWLQDKIYLWIILHTFEFVNMLHLNFILLSGNNENNSFEISISFDHLRSSDLSSYTVIIPTSKLKKTLTFEININYKYLTDFTLSIHYTQPIVWPWPLRFYTIFCVPSMMLALNTNQSINQSINQSMTFCLTLTFKQIIHK